MEGHGSGGGPSQVDAMLSPLLAQAPMPSPVGIRQELASVSETAPSISDPCLIGTPDRRSSDPAGWLTPDGIAQGSSPAYSLFGPSSLNMSPPASRGLFPLGSPGLGGGGAGYGVHPFAFSLSPSGDMRLGSAGNGTLGNIGGGSGSRHGSMAGAARDSSWQLL